MKLDWKRAGCASIAECGFKKTAHVWLDNEHGGWCVAVFDGGEQLDMDVPNDGVFKTPGGAEGACESWIEQHDRPEWHDVTDWLSWAEWRGWRLCVRPESVDPSRTQWSASKNGYCGGFLSIAGPDFPGAKSAAEKWVRGQGA